MKTRKKSLSVHDDMLTFDGLEADMQCLVCEAEFLDADDLKMHIKQMHSAGLVVCSFCDAHLSGPDEYATHFIRVHLEKVIVCFFCYRIFLDRLAFQEHQSKHRVVHDTSVNCSQCPQVYSNRYGLQRHEYNRHKDSKEGVLLNDVFPVLTSYLNIQAPRFLDALAKNKSFICTSCSFFSTNITDYVTHLKASNCQSVTCDKCLRVYKNRSGMLTHVARQPKCNNYVLKDLKRQCRKCEKEFDVQLFEDHVESCKAVKCPVCNVMFFSLLELSEHRVKDHKVAQAVSLQPCTYCRKEFVGLANLKKHMDRTHKDIDRYKYRCTYCGSVFRHPKKLFAHFFSKHKEIHPYTCKICNKTFRIRKSFSIHIKMEHKSVGFVEFDENLHVQFVEKKSEKPFIPPTPVDLKWNDSNVVDTEEAAKKSPKEKPDTSKKARCETVKEIESINVETAENTFISEATDSKSQDSEEMNLSELRADLEENSPLKLKTVSKPKKSMTKQKKQPLRQVRFKTRVLQQAPKKSRKRDIEKTELSDFSEEEPLSNIKESLQTQKKIRRKRKVKTAKLTCAVCNKYCYTYQNYHHHMSMHEKSKLKRCIKCQESFRSRIELKNHIDTMHSSSKLTETLKSLLEKKKTQNVAPDKPTTSPAESLKSLIEERKKAIIASAQNTMTYKFRKTIKKVDCTDDTKAKITPMTEHGVSVKKYIENFKPDADTINISNSVTFKMLPEGTERQPFFKLKKFKEEESPKSHVKLQYPVQFKEDSIEMKSNVTVKLVQELITKPKLLNFCIDASVLTVSPPSPEEEYSEYCNTFADETDYTQYKNDAPIPEVAHEVVMGDIEDIPRTKQLAQEIFIPNIPKEHGEVRIGHLLPRAPYYKIVQVKKLLQQNKGQKQEEEETGDTNIKLPDGTQLVTVNPFSHLIPADHLQKVLKANKNKYYTPRVKNIEKALAKALKTLRRPPPKKSKKKKDTEALTEVKGESVDDGEMS